MNRLLIRLLQLMLAIVLGASLLLACGARSEQETSLPMVLAQGPNGPVIALQSTHPQPLYLKGATVWGLASKDAAHKSFALMEWSNRQTIVQTIRAWGGNTLRLRIDAAAYGTTSGINKADYLAYLQGWVQLATQNGLTVVLCGWDALYQGSQWEYKEADKAFIRDVYQATASNSHVIWEPANEPNNISWSRWQTVTTDIVRFYRQLGYRGVLLLDTPGYSSSYSYDPMNSLVRLDKSLLSSISAQIAFARHDYATAWPKGWSPNDWLNKVGGKTNPFVVIESEFGNYNGPGTVNALWSQQVATYFGSGVHSPFLGGAIAFVWGPWTDSNAITTEDNQTPTPWGEDVKAFLSSAT
jgi:hypothetical protein